MARKVLMRSAVVAVSLLAAACAGRNRPPSTAAMVATGAICDSARMSVGADDRGAWREMRGDGFTYCVPGHWRSIGDRAQIWRAPDADLSWGEPHEAFDRATPVFRPGTATPHFGFQVITERVGGQTVRLYVAEPGAGSAFRTAAEWLEASLEFYGTATSAAGARDILAVVRSVRFTKR